MIGLNAVAKPLSKEREAYLASTPTLIPDKSRADLAPTVYVSNTSLASKYQASNVTGPATPITPTVAISSGPVNVPLTAVASIM